MSAKREISMSPTTTLFDRSARLYGRANELNQIRGWLTQPLDAVLAIVLQGEGGTGKTSLLRIVEESLGQDRPFLPLYDFYHIDNFKASAIESAIVESLTAHSSAAATLFEPYDQQRQQLDRARQSGDLFQQAQRKLRETFVACYNAYATSEHIRDRPVVLLFDTVEQAVDLNDNAETYMHGERREASKGGEFWLAETLPLLRNTVAVLAGRERTLFGELVRLYDSLKQKLSLHTIEVHGIPLEDEQQFILDQRDRLRAEDKPDDIRELARSIEFDDQTFTVWHAVSDGNPFWDSVLLTSAMLGAIPAEIDRLREAVFAGRPIAIGTEERHAARAALMREILAHGVIASDQPLILALQWMAFIRKGATPAILRAIAHDQGLDLDIQGTYDRLRYLDIVKTRRSPYARAAQQPAEDMLFLHDEIYSWLDQDLPTQSLREISTAVMRFYDREIAESERLRLANNDRLLELGQQHPEAQELSDRMGDELQRRRQLELDRLGYCYQSDLALGTRAYNLLSYAAILDRDVGYSVTLRQEALRNLYRLERGVSFAIGVECAARWVLRAVHTDDADALELVAKLPHYYEQESEHPGLHYALLYLADAQARSYLAEGSERSTALGRLQHAEAITQSYEQEYRQRNGGTSDPWCDFLRAEIHNWRGFCYRAEYQLPESIAEYRRMVSLHLRQPNLPRLFLGTTLNNLAYAYSEQGDLDEARRFGHQGLAIRQRHAGEYQVGLSYNTLARIELRTGTPHRATQLAQLAYSLFDRNGSVRGLSLCLPVLAESYRKQADLLVESISEQDAMFAKGVDTLEQAVRLIDSGDVKNPAQLCETYQRLGCIYRSWGVALLRRRSHDPQKAGHYFAEAQRWLERALDVAKQSQPPLIVMDIYQDLAVVLINQDQYGGEIETYLKLAEDLAPDEYRIKQDIGLHDIAQPVRAYWRLLGQCELQRMLIGFGKFDFGVRKSGDQGESYVVAQGNPQFLKDAAHHLVLALAYLMKYAYQSSLLDQARALALRELRLGRSEQQLKLMSQQAYQTAREYRLLNGPELRLAHDLMILAQHDLDLPLGLIQ